jgi:putative transposase
LDSSPRKRTLLLEKDHKKIPVSRQCELIGIARSTAYYSPIVIEEDLLLMNKIDEIYTQWPYYGKRRMSVTLKQMGYNVGVKRACSLMKRMGIIAIYPKKNISSPNKAHKKYPYLLRNVPICNVNQVWSTDITYIRLLHGFVYLVAVIDWFSRYVLSWKLSITMEKEFCIEALEESLTVDLPDIFNSDQGSQFTSPEFTKILTAKGIQISMDGKGRCLDNIFVERLWRSVKYEEVYLKQYKNPLEARQGLQDYFKFYNHERPHQSLNYKTPAQIYFNHIP